MNEISTQVRAVEHHERAISYYKASEQFGYKFIMEIKTIRDEKLFKELGYQDFEEYTTDSFGYSRNTINERIQTAEAWGSDYDRALGSYGKQKTKQLAIMPKEIRQDAIENGIPTTDGYKPVDEATTREIAEYKKQLKTKDEQISNLSEAITEMGNQEPQIVEKTVVVEKIPDDYEAMKQSYSELEERSYQLEANYRALLSERQEVEEKSAKYEQLTQAINQAKGQLNSTQQMISNYKKLSDLLEQSNEFLSKASALIYSDLSEVISRDGLAKRELDFLTERLEKFLSDLKKVNQNTILEGEIINE